MHIMLNKTKNLSTHKIWLYCVYSPGIRGKACGLGYHLGIQIITIGSLSKGLLFFYTPCMLARIKKIGTHCVHASTFLISAGPSSCNWWASPTAVVMLTLNGSPLIANNNMFTGMANWSRKYYTGILLKKHKNAYLKKKTQEYVFQKCY